MKSFNNKLEIGQPAMIIGCQREANRKWIGTIVTVEEFIEKGHNVTEHYVDPHKQVVTMQSAVRVSGYKGQPFIECVPVVYAKAGVGFFDAFNLMPLPPLEEEELEKEKELCYDH
jgi:hypothetical protein